MDIPRAQPRRRSRLHVAVALALAGAFGVLAMARSLRSAAPSVSRDGLMIATVKRGVFEREVRAGGRLVPRETRWVTAVTPGRVDEILQKPGATVTRDTVILELQNPDVVLASLEADRDVTTAEASALELETRLGSQAINERATVATLEAELSDAARRADVYGADLGLVVSKLDQTQMDDRARALSRGLELAQQRVELVNSKGQGAIAAWREQLVRRRKVAEFRRLQVEALDVRAGARLAASGRAVRPVARRSAAARLPTRSQTLRGRPTAPPPRPAATASVRPTFGKSAQRAPSLRRTPRHRPPVALRRQPHRHRNPPRSAADSRLRLLHRASFYLRTRQPTHGCACSTGLPFTYAPASSPPMEVAEQQYRPRECSARGAGPQ